ncbi:Ig-like domain-containing protein [Candidatus Roizmanbacteria bacterium]|nr:Ig-like domain-containing protein [Candidatus Roizmanbacteria bacterium]
MKKFIATSLIIFFVLLIFSGLFWFYEARFLVGRASTIGSGFSKDNSYVFISPLRAKANSQEKIRVTVFILNNQGLGVAGKKVLLDVGKELAVETIQGVTDPLGKAVFDVSSGEVGEYNLGVKVDETVLPQQVHVTYY